MDIVIHSMGMPFNGNTINTKSLGGSETAAYYMARELAARGHRVIAFTNSTEEGVFDGVEYTYSGPATKDSPLGERFTTFACNTPHDVLIIQRHPMAFHKDYASKLNILQLHDLALRRTANIINAGAGRIDAVTTVSQFHKEQVEKVYGFREGFVHVVPNGIDLDLYRGDEERNDKPLGPKHPVTVARRDNKVCYLYQSRPERGLEHLVRPGGIMNRLHEVGSDAHLFVCAYDHVTAEMAPYYAQLNEFCASLPNVTLLGALTKRDLANVQQACDALVYPTEFEEVSCITAMEAMAAGLPLITSAHGALPETCKDSGTIALPLKDGKADESAFVETMLLFEQNVDGRKAYRDAQLEAAATRSWEDAVDALEDVISHLFEKRSSSPARVIRHLIEHSDISAATHEIREKSYNDGTGDAIQTAAVTEVEKMYAFAESPEATLTHYAKWEGMNCDRMAENGMEPDVEHESIIRTTRYAGIAHFLGDLPAGARVLEFGCAHGHITLALAAQFPHLKFVGMDFMERSITLARDTCKNRKLTNVTFEVGSLDDLENFDAFDAIVAPEVIEHILDYRSALNKLIAATKTDGRLIFTTPCGRWEWSGREWWQKGREHLHHFERDDLKNLFQEFEHKILHAPAGHEMAGGALGSWVTCVWNNERGVLGDIDLDRKFATCAPRDTISLCMIVHNAALTIERSLRSVVGYVDEVVIGLDARTNDATAERVHTLMATEFPNTTYKVLTQESPMVIGFDAARNLTIDASCGDWIFWLDSDEEVVNPHNIWRCLRPGAFNSYSIAQHHMSQNPPGTLSTDLPCRLFRRDSGARFYGVVHEHPEVVVGKAIPHTQSLPDVYIMHHGYTDEAVRRKRYERNFPLLLRDLEKNPDRIINRFLYLRDLAQSIAFEGQMTQAVSQAMIDRAWKCVGLFEELIEKNPMFRMTLDAVPYYSTAVATLMTPQTFHVKLNAVTRKDELPGLEARATIDGLFHSRELFEKLMVKMVKETTNNYDETYM